ncbi:glycosyl transferase family 2 [Mesorhizobium sp. YIM 152430]|uniref:glycosyl transferase family 2 n=1 Tax=Mesorhizobium sp. YIM 152430 TaxID=3031761 RepID=UPI0023DC40FC|nr:glycosyl transferase family 2 [Mesorhizobium sp. YIM 152430]MDF1599581.1 glycosyl transferase family 2 [Mesorhizobium sp. YIM 152430]
MISVLIETKDDEEGLAKTLASLVSGAVEGLVREVIVCDLGSSDGTETVAEHAGCIFLAGTRCEEAVAGARSEWVLMLKPGARLAPGWVEAAREHVAAAESPAIFSRSRQSELPFWSKWLKRRERFAEGLLMRRTSSMKVRPLRLRAEIHAV